MAGTWVVCVVVAKSSTRVGAEGTCERQLSGGRTVVDANTAEEVATGVGEVVTAESRAARDEIEILSLGVEEPKERLGRVETCIVEEARRFFVAAIGVGGGGMPVEDGLTDGGAGVGAVVIARARDGCAGGFTLQGQTWRIASMKPVASKAFWKFIWKRR